ncbi:MAG: dTDP-4-dehydrorhamnose 3,5-epimerase [Proteobacteria bacterium]|nr:dTDP-4-dehydrorhamnose 3,5-epimerase [Pseudomonadota bacterium]
MTVEQTPLEGVMLITPQMFGDDRGFFMETFNAKEADQHGLPTHYVQDNHSRSSRGVLRGLHYQHPQWQGKLLRVLGGEIFDVAVDIRAESATFGDWFGVSLSDQNKRQLYIPPGFAHGFLVTSEFADVAYKVTTLYEPSMDAAIRWNDPAIGVDWPLPESEILLSEKDKVAPMLGPLDGGFTLDG